MSQTPHIERHFTASALVRDIVIGMSDGLTVPFALAAGLSGAVSSNAIIVTAGLAEIAAGSIAMGLGGYLAARTDEQHYHSEMAREHRETLEIPEEEAKEVAGVFRSYGLDEPHIQAVVEAIRSDHTRWVDFMMKFELGIDKPDPSRARTSAFTIGLAYIVGGLIPLSPYMGLASTRAGLEASVIVTLLALLLFGYVKGLFTIKTPVKSALQTVAVGGLAAAAAFFIAKWVS